MGKQRKPKADELDRFKAFIAQHGGEVLTPTNPYEVVRFRGNGITSIIYAKDNGTRSYVGEAREAFDAFTKDQPFRLAKATARVTGTRRMAPIDQAIRARDGAQCFYCDGNFTPENPRTREHLVSATAGGPNHISNLFHACRDCNTAVGHLSAPEKIRFRDSKRSVDNSTPARMAG